MKTPPIFVSVQLVIIVGMVAIPLAFTFSGVRHPSSSLWHMAGLILSVSGVLISIWAGRAGFQDKEQVRMGMLIPLTTWLVFWW